MAFERFNKTKHNAESFSCGKRSMDDFLRSKGASEAYGNTYVVVKDDDETEIIAYYTIQPDPEEISEEFDEGDSITYIVLERIAVDEKYQRQGVGKWILKTLFEQIHNLS